MVVVAEESNHSEYQSTEQQYGFKSWPIVVGRSEGEEWGVVFVECGGVAEFGAICLFVCVGQQLNNSLEELYFPEHNLTDKFTADDNFIHLGKLKKLDLSSASFSKAGCSAISLMLQVDSLLI